jgi:hypothetical protein
MIGTDTVRPKRRAAAPAPRATVHARPDGQAAYDADVAEFAAAMQEYKRSSGRMFPTWSEVLEVLQGLGFRKPEGRASAS